MIAPSDMMDGRIGAIKDALEQAGFGTTVTYLEFPHPLVVTTWETSSIKPVESRGGEQWATSEAGGL